MKSNIKKKSGYVINICLILLILMSTPIGQASVSANRTIEKNVLTAGTGTNVTVIIQNDNNSVAMSFDESIPPGWNLTNISCDGCIRFKPTTNEWLWVIVENNTVKTVKYRITSGTIPGTYIINGNVTVNNTPIKVTGDLTIKVTSDSSGSSGSGGSSGSSSTPTITPTPRKNDINVTATPTEAIEAANETIAPVETATEIPIATTNNKSSGFGIMISIGIIATIYILRKMK
jgi:hypothetical protein